MARRLRLGIVGMGRAFTFMLPTFLGDERVQLVAAADPREEARRRFVADFAGAAYPGVEELCADPRVEAVYIASPHQDHAAHAVAAAGAGKHVMVEKPMALTLAECRTMIDAARSAGVHLIVGHSHSFDLPYRRAREIIASGRVGKPRMIAALNYTDFMYRPRRPEELVTDAGGGVIFSQGAHQIDVIRLLGGGLVRSVRANAGIWDPARPTEGAYAAHLTFEDGTFASAVYNGYGYFDSDELCDWIGEMGERKDPADYGAARRRLRDVQGGAQEAALKNQRNYGGAAYVPPQPGNAANLQHQHFGTVVASCERGDVRPLPDRIMVYEDRERLVEQLVPPPFPRREVIDEFYSAVVEGRPPLHSGEWAMATLEVCLAILESARRQAEVPVSHQVPVAEAR